MKIEIKTFNNLPSNPVEEILIDDKPLPRENVLAGYLFAQAYELTLYPQPKKALISFLDEHLSGLMEAVRRIDNQ